jgi:sorting nexin-8
VKDPADDLADDALDVNIESVASLAQQNDLPVPNLDMASIAASTIKTTFPPPRPGPTYNAEADPWTAGNRSTWAGSPTTPRVGGASATASILSSGLPAHWWKGLEQINVTIHGQQGLFFNRFTLYSVHSYSRGTTVLRR